MRFLPSLSLLVCFALSGFPATVNLKNGGQIPKTSHVPMQPHSGEAVIVTAQTAGPQKSVVLEYQVVEPGNYIARADSDYRSRWTPLPMTSLSETNYQVELPAALQKHRRLVRYRITATGVNSERVVAPASDDPEPNFAYFVSDGIPSWSAAIEPGSSDPKKGRVVRFPGELMSQVQSYHLIAKNQDVENATWYRQSNGKEYPYTGTLVANGKVYDHIRFRARGGVWRYAMGKNMWKFDFNKGHSLRASDDYGQPYKTKWAKLNLRACIQQGDYGRRGEQGMYETVGFRLFNLAGVEAPRTHWISLRIVSGKEEKPPDQYKGDFWGLYLAIENEDGKFLEDHGLPDGNLYKMMMGRGEVSHLGANQSTNGTDLRRFVQGWRSNSRNEDWWRSNVDLPRYYSYRSIVEAIHHYDIGDGKNYDFYLNPATAKWQVVPWDIDLTWGDHMYGGGYEPFYQTILSQPEFRLEYQNRLREIRDLLFNPQEVNRLIDECAAIIARPGGALSIVDADRAKWDYHPIMTSRYAMRGKAGHGLFYAASPTKDFAGIVAIMKSYVVRRAKYIDQSLINDLAIPATPAVSYAGPAKVSAQGLKFACAPFSGRGQFAAMKWRVGEIAPATRTEPGRYEITTAWESKDLAQFQPEIQIPPKAVKPGHTYRARARFKENTGRWSHWSNPIEFAIAE